MTSTYKDKKSGLCMADYDYLPEPIPTFDCFCKPQGCKAWDDFNALLEWVVLIVLVIMLAGAVVIAAHGMGVK